MLETGISLVAVNLPSLWLLFTSVTPEKVIRSIRSVLSLGSLRSGGSSGANGYSGAGTSSSQRPYGKEGSTNSTRPSESSTAKIHPRAPEDIEAQGAQVVATPGGSDRPVDGHEMGVYVQNTVSIQRHPS